MAKIYRTKTGQPYILLKNGKARFIKRGSARRRAVQRGASTRTTNRSVQPMARRRRSASRRSGGVRRYFRRRSSVRGLSVGALVTTSAATIAVDMGADYLINRFAPQFAAQDDVAKAVLGYLLATGKIPMLKMPALREAGKVLAIVNTAKVLGRYVTPAIAQTNGGAF